MKKFLLPLGMILVGAGIGGGAAYATRAQPEDPAETLPELDEATAPCGPSGPEAAEAVLPIEPEAATEYALLEKQFLVPVIEDEALGAMMLVTVSIEVPEGEMDQVFAKEPRLRDRLLQDMFAHANIGGFTGNYTHDDKMQVLREDLLRSARDIVGETALDVLVLDIVRQDV
ncbi:flagellar basal body-associated protein FliL [Salipiger sp. IMCC34102]|uniref:flagellar basal body-associated protein FliL n=1 Tax=Salipiger sp. IMCC34102 TaxID=2510647 RepID=UPI00101E07AC|nr:flagellar basal body-associated protein FliL [Salipiger sp. IMCC34102]RYH01565.1 flagellar basal body-associated protein FliL [Salipiger sp. IMCC34102]